MHVTIALAVGVGVFALPVAFFAPAGRSVTRRGGLDKSGVPSSGQASYDPVVDPGDRVQ